MKKIINATPHVLNFRDKDGTVFTVPSSGVIDAEIKESLVEYDDGTVFVEPYFLADEKSYTLLLKLEAENPGAVIVGSLIAAQAYPGRVCAVTPVKGFERMPPNKKIVNPYKFTRYSE